jgi:hypothetical protein
MNNNNLYNNNNFIGITHLDNYNITSNFILNTSNILESHLYNTSNILESHLYNTSNILESHLSNTSNILDSKASNFTTTTSNLILARYDKLIGEKTKTQILPPTNITDTYIYNNNDFGNIYFKTKFNYPLDSNLVGTYIDYTGKLYLYHNYNILQPTFPAGYYDIEGEILALKADGINTDGQLTTLEAGALFLQNEIDSLIIATNLIDARLNALISQLYNNPTYQSFRNAIERQDLPSLQAEYAILINQIRLNGTNIYNSSIATGTTTNILWGITAAIGGAIGTMAYYAYASNAIFSNVNFTTQQKRELYEANFSNQAQTYIEYRDGTSNLLLNTGFINCNIQTQQYIRDLKCDSLNLNTGNISGINYINVNNIIADGRIKENNKFLDTTYLTSNHIYNLSNVYSSERQYPPKLYNNTSPEDTTTLLNKLVYRNILYLDNNNITYGNGFYEVYSSSTYDTPTTKNKLFNFDTAETTDTPRWGISLYNSGTGDYQGDNSIDNIYYGDWVILKMPQPILLTRYRIYQNTQFPNRAPSEWKVYGSNDGITFTQITEAHQLTRLLASDYTFYYYNKALATTFTTSYQYIGFVFNKLVSTSGATTLNFVELQIFGKEILSNSIVSNIYTTSNAVRNIVQYDMPPMCKHLGIYCEITTPISINAITYYKYDLDLSQYTKLGVIQIGAQSGDTFRIFKISMFYASMYFDILTANEINICSYDIYMAWKQNGIGVGGSGGFQGLNVAAVGLPPNQQLKTILNTDFFILRNGNNSINYITLMAKNPSLVRVLIEDRIG